MQCRSVGWSPLVFFGVFGILDVFCITAPAQMLYHHCPCPPARNFGSRVSGLVSRTSHLFSIYIKMYRFCNFGCNSSLQHLLNKNTPYRSWFFLKPKLVIPAVLLWLSISLIQVVICSRTLKAPWSWQESVLQWGYKIRLRHYLMRGHSGSHPVKINVLWVQC